MEKSIKYDSDFLKNVRFLLDKAVGLNQENSDLKNELSSLRSTIEMKQKKIEQIEQQIQNLSNELGVCIQYIEKI